jgi:hypothetical protein
MKKFDIAQILQVFANLGVIAGIVLLAIEVRQNNDLLGIQIRANAISRVQGTTDIVLQNPDLIDLLGKKQESLTQPERDRLVLLGIRSLSTFQNAYEDTARGILEEGSVRRAVQSVWRRKRLNYGMPIAWETFKDRGDPAFVAWMEENVVDEKPELNAIDR